MLKAAKIACVVAAASGTVLALQLPPSGASASKTKCARPGTTTLLANRQARVFKRNRSGVKIGCLLATGKRTGLDLPPDVVAYPRPALALAGPIVGYATEGTGDPDARPDTRIQVVDLRTGGSPSDYAGSREDLPFATSRANFYDAKVGSLRVKTNGAVAWIACRTEQNFEEEWGDPRPSCVRPGAFDEVRKLEPGDSEPKTLDTGRRIDPRSLRLHGDRLYWLQRGKRRSAILK